VGNVDLWANGEYEGGLLYTMKANFDFLPGAALIATGPASGKMRIIPFHRISFLRVLFLMSRPLVAITHIAAMHANLAAARKAVPSARTWAVVKADAYGHGLGYAVRAFDAADGLSLIEFDRAARLRELGWQKPIMMMQGMYDVADIEQLVRDDLQPVIHHVDQCRMLETTSVQRPLAVHLKINTGMNRLGFMPFQVSEIYQRLKSLPSVRSVSLMTHFANADSEHTMPDVDAQVVAFKQAIAGIDAEISLSNSAATLLQPQIQSDWIRPGVMLYGGAPGRESAASLGLQPAMTLQSRVIATQSLRAGDSVGYGSLFMADKPMRIGIVACGYADGYPRLASTDTPVLVNGLRTRILGRVSMDMLTIDLSPLPNADVGSEVILWGKGLPIDEVAAHAGTIGYELMCGVAPRVRREAHD
jgi:alanine racemase